MLILGCVAAWLLIGRFDLGPFAARWASASLGRTVTVASLHVTPGRWLTIELDGVRLDNIAGGTAPTMAELRHVTAEVEAVSLARGPVMIRHLVVDGMTVLLERTADGTKNWKFGPDKPKADPTGRSSFPALLEARLSDGEITVRTSGGKPLRTHLDDAAVQTGGTDQPVRLTGTGSYNGTSVRLDGDLASIDALRDVAKPFPVTLHMASGETTLDFKGTMTDPLNVDGAKGALALVAPSLKPILAMAGASGDLEASARLAGQLDRNGDLWRMSGASGAIENSEITAASLRLKEGGHGEPDDVAVEVAFDQLELDRLLGRRQAASQSGADIPLAVDDAPGTLLEAKLSARGFVYNGLRGSDAKLAASMKPGVVAVSVFSMTYLGARAQASGRIEGAGDGGRVTANVSLAGADMAQFARALSFGAVPIAGKLDAEGTASAKAATLNAAVRGAQVAATVSMTGGAIARNVIELASLDVRRLFRKPSGMTPVSCLLAVLDMHAGSGTVLPLRVRAAEGTVIGHARFDLYRRWFDLTIGTQPSTTSGFALDVPMEVSGPFASPTVRPARWSAEGRAMLAAGFDLTRLPPRIRDLARRNPCASIR